MWPLSWKFSQKFPLTMLLEILFFSYIAKWRIFATKLLKNTEQEYQCFFMGGGEGVSFVLSPKWQMIHTKI
jgi:hypothetical protein